MRSWRSRRGRPPTEKGASAIAYRDLGVEQLGAVYETLLDYAPHVDAGHSREADGACRCSAGSDVRKATGTFYTPQSLAAYLLRETLGAARRAARRPSRSLR